MNRRTFVKSGAAATLASGLHIDAQPATRRKQPNILFVFGDQHRAQSLPGEEFNQAVAPNFEKFRRENFSMDCCVSNYPLCSPWRAMLISGRWPYQTGVVHNNLSLSPNETTLGHTFANNGYYTGYIGKWHLAGGESPGFIPKGPRRMGFEHWQVWDVTNMHYRAWTFNQDTGEKIFPQGWQPTRMTDEAIEFIQRQSPAKPWFLALSWNPPHPPFDPPPEDQAPYRQTKFTMRPNVKLRPDQKGGRNETQFLESEDLLHTAMRGYYGGITGIDLEFARLLKTLDETGQANDTIVIYTSDHGEMMGSHGRMAKQVPFEESCRVPFLIRYPGVTPKGGRSQTLFAGIDIYPTLCGLADIPIPPHCVGRDFSAVMRGGKQAESEMVFLMNQVDMGSGGEGKAEQPTGHGETTRFGNQPTYRGLRTKRYTYAVADSGRWLLYDNTADPYQLKNLVNDPSQKPLMDKFDQALQQWITKTGDNFPLTENARKITNFPS